MKSRLTKEQTQTLIRLGISETKASSRIEIQSNHIICTEYRFTLIDLFEILPAEIYDREENISYCLQSIVSKNGCIAGYGQIKFNNDELIDCLYQLVCWYIENKDLL